MRWQHISHHRRPLDGDARTARPWSV